jgi:anti-sigma B factor antagonist
MGSFALELERPGGDGAPVLAVRGELDLYTAPEFRAELTRLAESSGRGLVVDLGASTFVDSSACRALLRAARRLAARGGRLVVVNRDPEIARMFSVMGLDELMAVVRSRHDAKDALAAA